MSSSLVRTALAFALVAALGACQSKTNAQESAKPANGEGVAFLAKMAKVPGVHVLPDGLQYKIVKSGPADGTSPRLGDEVKVDYEGTLVDGTVFDSSYKHGEPIVFTLGEVIPGWNEALQKMKPGDVWYIYVPAELGYGDRAAGPIPPGSVLIFKVELHSVLSHGGGANG